MSITSSATRMPPRIGAAIGFMNSDPTPVDQSIGISARIIVPSVSSFGRRRATALDRLPQVDHHDDAGLRRQAEAGHVADPDRRAERVAEDPLEDRAARD